MNLMHFSCSGFRTATHRPPEYETKHTFYNFSSIRTLSSGDTLKVTFSISQTVTGILYEHFYDARNRLVTWSNEDLLLFNKPASKGVRTRIGPTKVDDPIQSYTHLREFETDSNASITFSITNAHNSYYKFFRLIPHSKQLSVENTSNEHGERICTVTIDIEGEPFYDTQPYIPSPYSISPDKTTRDWESYKNRKMTEFRNANSEFRQAYSEFELYGLPTEILLAKRRKERIEYEEQLRRLQIEKEQEQIRAEKRQRRIQQTLDREIESHLEDLIVNVLDADEETSIENAEVVLISRAKGPHSLLSSFLSGQDLHDAISLSTPYLHDNASQKGVTGRDGKFIFRNIYRPAKYYLKVIAGGYKAFDIRPHEREPIIGRGTATVYLKLSARGLRIEFGGKQPSFEIR